MKHTLWNLWKFPIIKHMCSNTTIQTNNHTSVEVTFARLLFLNLVLELFDFWILINLNLMTVDLTCRFILGTRNKESDLLTLTKVPTEFPIEHVMDHMNGYFK